MTTTTLQQDLETQKEAIAQFLKTKVSEDFPCNLQDSMNYIIGFKGKRLRPLMLLMIAQGFGVSIENAISAAISVEVFHNSTLIHDDIMDQATLRRGQTTVHEKYGVGKAIITGDAMLPHAIRLLIKGNEKKSPELIQCFLKMAGEVMEGQQFDMEFETKDDVAVPEYMNMIRLKTSVLFGCACELGAILGEASGEDQRKLYDFGLYNGLAFQIMDDYLDTFGDDRFGKRIGGDILLNKKTFLLINALKKANENQQQSMNQLFKEKDEQKKISGFQTLFKEIGVDKIALEEMESLNNKSLQAVKSTAISEESKEKLIAFSQTILHRTI